MSLTSLVCLAGPTASGKTAMSISLAKSIDAEIISVDSALVYRGMDIGTAKPTLEERDGVIHHLIDIIEPDQAYSAARFVQDAKAAIDQIQARGRVPLLVGGTMLYFKALIEGMNELPQTRPEIRQQVQLDLRASGLASLYAELEKVDPNLASRLHASDTQRICRGIEVFRMTGKPLSELQSEEQKSVLKHPVLFWGLMPQDRSWLHKRIALRYELMLQSGFRQEVTELLKRYRMTPDMPSMRSVGYRQLWDWIRGEITSEAEMQERGIIATRQLAKRQMTWLRSWEDAQLISPDKNNCEQKLMDGTREWLERVK